MKRIIVILLMAGILMLSGCREAYKVSYNVSKEADSFNVVRRLTVINTRTDKCLLQMVGRMSIEDQTNGIAVLVEIDREKGLYQKHYVYMNEWTMYTVEDVSGVEVSRYQYELEFMPEALKPVKITVNEFIEDMQEGDAERKETEDAEIH